MLRQLGTARGFVAAAFVENAKPRGDHAAGLPTGPLPPTPALPADELARTLPGPQVRAAREGWLTPTSPCRVVQAGTSLEEDYEKPFSHPCVAPRVDSRFLGTRFPFLYIRGGGLQRVVWSQGSGK